MMKSKILLLCLAMVLALGGLGVAYAHWSDTVAINQVVETGTVSIGFSKQFTGEPWGEVENKNVGSISCELIGPIKGYVAYPGNPNTPVYTSILVTMSNAYPSYQTALWADVANVGTIPVKITSLVPTMVEVDENQNVIEVLTWVVDGVSGSTTSGHFENSNGDTVFEMAIVNLVGTQLHPGDKDVVEFDMHVQQPAKQNATYIITIAITGTQWNLVP